MASHGEKTDEPTAIPLADYQLGEVHPAALKKTVPDQDYDDAVDLFAGDNAGFAFEYSAKEANRVLWKLDLVLLPLMTVTYMISFIDKVALGDASIFGIEEYDHLKGQDYSWVNSIFYFGYLLFQYPASRLMQKYPIGRFFGTTVVVWGIVTTTTAATNSFATLSVNRFFLGVFEACLPPVLTILVGQYWTRQEHAFRACIWWSGAALAGFVTDGITYSVSGTKLRGSKLEIWQVLYLIVGPISIAWGVILFWAIPTSPMTAWFLNSREKKIATMRAITNHTGIENRHYKHYQVLDCLKDPQVWMLFCITFLQCIPGGGLTAFDKIVFTGLGYTDRQSTVLSLKEDVIQFGSTIFAGLICSYIPNCRIFMMFSSSIVILVGSVLIDVLPASATSSKVAAFLSLSIIGISYIMCISVVSSNIAGFTKKATAGVVLFVSYSIGQIITPQLFLNSQAPSYETAFQAFYASTTLCMAFQLALASYLFRENRRRDRAAAAIDTLPQAMDSDGHVVPEDFLDLTDQEQSSFRYVL